MNYLLTGGGTGGHVYPALAIWEQLKERDPRGKFLFVGVRGRAEARLVPPLGIRFKTVSSKGFPGRNNPFRLVGFSISLLCGIMKAMGIIILWKPDVIVATGGYVSAPVVCANEILRRIGLRRVPVLIHEQNAIPGLMNRFAAKWATCVAVSYPSTVEYLPRDRTRVLGYPVRKSVYTPPDRTVVRDRLGIPSDAEVLLVFGGSLGARSINKAIVGALPRLMERRTLFILHATGYGGGKQYDPVRETEADLSAMSEQPDPTRYRRFEYLDPIADFYAAADLVVCRAGAGTLNELSTFGKPALLIPKANLPGDHQVRNALIFQNAGAAEVMYEEPVRSSNGILGMAPSEQMAHRIIELFENGGKRAKLGRRIKDLSSQDASSRIAKAVMTLGNGGIPADDLPTAMHWPELDSSISCFAGMGGAQLLHAVKIRMSNSDPLTSHEKRYLHYRTDGYLASDQWEERNIGVKLSGVTRRSDRTGLLASMISGTRKNTSIVARMFHLTHGENDFIRRNALIAIGEIGEWNDDVKCAILHGLSDSYYENRSAAAETIAKLAGTIGVDESISRAIRSLLDDRWFEVRVSALKASGEIAGDPSWVKEIAAFFTAENWKVRNAAIMAIARLIERDILAEDTVEFIKNELGSVLLTTTDFKPMFELKRSLVMLSDSLKEN